MSAKIKGEKDLNFGLFAGMHPDIVEDVTKGLKRIKHAKGEEITSDEFTEQTIYFICSGKVEVPADPRVKLPARKLAKGDYFGAGWIASGSATDKVRFLEDSEIMEIPRADFGIICFYHPVVSANLIREIAPHIKGNEKMLTAMLESNSLNSHLLAVNITAGKILNDIKTPLTIISLTAQMIEGIYPDSGEFTRSIIRQAQLLESNVREIRDLVQNTRTELNVRKVDLFAFLNDIDSSYGVSLKGRGIKLTVENKCSEPVYFDEERIRLVIVNMLRNSSEAMSGKGEIKITASMSTGWLQISVADDGPGVPESIVPRLFEPFIIYGKETATGLGLPLSAKIVAEHSGKLDYQPVKPHGSKFDIRLPQNLH
ncbi:MAG TPA: ATP-binding protein [Candidatus Syntrophosphaera sp.]|jgi:signal transduction histidine kinase|nr:ATP-binding protein [Candidatus Syntrophosphaera sp.]